MAIHFLHDFRYWTEYVHPYLDPARFSLLRSRRADNSYPAPRLDPANAAQRDIVLAGHSNETFGPHMRVVARVQHSPGFGGEAFLHAYRWLHVTPHRMMIPGNVLALLRTTRLLAPNQFALRDHLVANPKLLITEYDPCLNAFYRAPRAAGRVPGTVLVALNWRITVAMPDLQRALEAIQALAKSHAVKVIAHPFSAVKWIGSKHHDALVAACRAADIPIAADISRRELMLELDKAEYILTDGSGSVYEAVARGCKALLLDGLSYQRGGGIFSAALAAGLLPSTRAANYGLHPGIAHDLTWLKKLHPNSIVDEDISLRASDELARAFEKW